MFRTTSIRTTLLAVLAGAIIASVYAGPVDDNGQWKCTHGEHPLEDPVLLDVQEDWNPEGNDHSGRTLTTYSNLRMYGYYGAITTATTAFKSYIENDLIPPILSYWSAALKVKYPVSGLLKTTASTICGVTTPSVLKTGVEADFVYFVAVDSSSDYVASSGACSLASGTKRPLMGKTTISTEYLSATTDPVLHEKNMICIMHEVVHTLGFTTGLYDDWLNSAGTTLTGHVLSATLDGYTAVVLNVDPLTTKLRDYFGCSTLIGAYMENTGSSGTAGCHFERRQFGFEAMTSGLITQMQFSQFTLALLEGMGWYVADYDYADPFFFGQGEGCSFLTGTCTSTSFTEWCDSSLRGCTVPGRGGATCRDDTRSDGCMFYHPVTDYDCENSGSESYARLPDLQTFGRGEGSKCFEGTLASSKAGTQTTFCFVPTCSGSGSSTELTIKVGSTSVVCTAAGTKSVSGYAGTITCPDPLTFCDTVGQKICPRNCMGRGTCVSGVCDCNSGYTGEDCALNS